MWHSRAEGKAVGREGGSRDKSPGSCYSMKLALSPMIVHFILGVLFVCLFFRKWTFWGGPRLVIFFFFLRILWKICNANAAECQQGAGWADTLLELFVLLTFLSPAQNWQLILLNFHAVISAERVFL